MSDLSAARRFYEETAQLQVLPERTVCPGQPVQPVDSLVLKAPNGCLELMQFEETVPIDGLLREWHINNTDVPVPIFCDSQSTIFISKAVTSIRRTVWLERRAIVLREYVESREFVFIKIAGELNIADGLTKPMTQATYKLHLSYSHPYAGLPDEERQVVSDTFHRLANMPLT